MPASIRYLDDVPRSASLVVIGGGVLGAATALSAGRAGMEPLLIEKRSALCTLTTPASTGAFRLQFDNAEELELVRESMELFHNFDEMTKQSDYDLRLRQQGYLWCTTDPERAEAQRRLVERQHEWGQTDIEVLGGDEVRARWPYIGDNVVQARWRVGDGFLDPKTLTLGMIAGSEAGVVLDCGVVGFVIDGNRLKAVETEQGRIETDAAVICCGPFSRFVARLAGVDLPVELIARQKIVIPELPAVSPDAPMTIDEDTGTHWRPAFSRGVYLIYTDPTTPPSDEADHVPVDVDGVFKVLDPRRPMSAARISPFWRDVWEDGSWNWIVHTGQYTMSPDRRPLIGETTVEGLFVNSGDSGHGVMSGPAAGRYLVDVLTGDRAPVDNPFRLDRDFIERAHDVL